MPDTQSFHPTNPSFREIFLKTLANDDTLPYKLKCVGFAFILYAFGAFTTLMTNTFSKFIIDYAFLATTVAGGLTLCLIVSACKQIDLTIANLDPAFKHSEKEEFARFLQETNDCRFAVLWYHLLSISFSAFFAILSFLGVIGPPWVKAIDPASKGINLAYYMLWCAVMGYGVGVALYLLKYYSSTIHAYSERFLTSERINLLIPTFEMSGLRPLGKLSLRFSIACSVPTFAILVTVFSHYMGEGAFLLSKPAYGALTVAYAGILILVFFFPLRQSHRVLVQAKKNAIVHLDKMIQPVIDSNNINDTETLLNLNGICLIRERVLKKSSWPVDLDTLVRFLATVIFPIVGGALLQTLLEGLL